MPFKNLNANSDSDQETDIDSISSVTNTDDSDDSYTEDSDDNDDNNNYNNSQIGYGYNNLFNGNNENGNNDNGDNDNGEDGDGDDENKNNQKYNIPTDFEKILQISLRYVNQSSIILQKKISMDLFNFINDNKFFDKFQTQAFNKYIPLDAVSMIGSKIDWSVICSRNDLTSDFIKKNIFRGINLLNESLNYVISIYVQRIKCCFNNPV